MTLAAEGRGAPATLPQGLDRLPGKLVVLNQSDPRGSQPELLANLPSIVQFVGAMATSQPGPGGPAARFVQPADRPGQDPDAG